MLLDIPSILLAVTLGPALSEIVLIAAIVVVLYIIFKLGNLILGLILNSILGLIAIYIVNYLFALGIVYSLLTIVIVAITGLPGAAAIILLKLVGISL
jgi:hypothetical protein